MINRMLQRRFATNLSVLALFALITFLAHWSILLGDNIMKWDIWAADYPNQMFISDALAQGTFPMWNPLEMFGTPYYTVIGMPVLYPLTLFVNLFGVSIVTVAINYALHVMLGAFGTYLLVRCVLQNGQKPMSVSTLAVSVISGVIYCMSGLFLSNAQHIMIIISAAWIPFVFYFMLRYLRERRIYLLMLSAVCASLIWLGGYPEMFYDLFLLLFPFTIYLGYKRKASAFSSLLRASAPFFLLCAFTILASAVTMLPFLNIMSDMTRTGVSQNVMSMPFISFISAVLPDSTHILPEIEPSMSNFYMSIFLIVTLPMLRSVSMTRLRKMNLGLAIFCFVVMWGETAFLHTLLYNVLPGYSTFRFPSTLRAPLTLLLILLLADVWREILQKKSITPASLKFTGFLFAGSSLCTIAASVYYYAFTDQSSERLLSLVTSGIICAVIFGAYLLIFSKMSADQLFAKRLPLLLSGIVLAECLTFTYFATATTISHSTPIESQSQKMQDFAEVAVNNHENRDPSIEFKDSERSTSGFDSQYIAFNKTFDEEGYLSFKLQAPEAYKTTANRSVITSNPVVYFTNDVITDVDYSHWVQDLSVSPAQIYVNTPLNFSGSPEQLTQIQPSIIETFELSHEKSGNTATVTEKYAKDALVSRILRVYVEDSELTHVHMSLDFNSDSGEIHSTSADFDILRDEQGSYIQTPLPDVNTTYSSIKISLTETVVRDIVGVTYERLNSVPEVEVTHFGYNSARATVQVPTEGYLVILQTYNEYWNAYVDGQPADIELINETFMGLHVSSGIHEITLEFRPTDLYVGLGITVSFYVALLIAFIFSKKKQSFSDSMN